MKTNALISLTLLVFMTGFSALAEAQEVATTVVLFRSLDDPSVADPTVCDPARTGFVANIVSAGTLWSSATRANDGVIVRERIKEIGTVTACLAVADLGFPEGGENSIYLLMNTGDLRVEAEGKCEVTSNFVPAGGPIFAACHTAVIPARSTPGIRWGHVTTNTSLAPVPLPGFEAGSFYAMRLVWD